MATTTTTKGQKYLHLLQKTRRYFSIENPVSIASIVDNLLKEYGRKKGVSHCAKTFQIVNAIDLKESVDF